MKATTALTNALALTFLFFGLTACLEPDDSDPRVCGPVADGTCHADEYCHFEIGAACGDALGAVGECRSMPDACFEIYAPVCGCDGETYSNECEAQMSDTPIAYEGECESVVTCTAEGDCAEDQYCDHGDEACGRTDLAVVGTCEPRPEGCDLSYTPVCGCDGVTYGNQCEANAAGQDILHLGECELVVSCTAAADCDEDEYCDHGDEACSTTGLPVVGTCEPRPEDCASIFDPICGCDGVTYGNECEANAAGQDVLYKGECAELSS